MTPNKPWGEVPFGEFLTPNKRPYFLGPTEDANLVGMRWYGLGPFHREFKLASKIRKKSHFRISAGDVIFNKLFAWKGTFGVVPPELDGMYVSDKFPTYRLDERKCIPGYLAWYFRHSGVWEQARRLSTGSAAVSKLTLNPPRFLQLTIPLPPLPIQHALEQQISAIAAQIDAAKAASNRSVTQASAVFTALLREMGEQLPPVSTLASVLRAKPRNGWSAKCDNADDGTPILTLSAVTGYNYSPLHIKRTSLPTEPDAHYWLRPGDLLISRSNTPELVGHASIYDGTPSPCIYPDLIMRLEVNTDIADPHFVWLWLQTPVVREYIMRNAKGTSPTMKKISQGIVSAVPFPDSVALTTQSQWVEKLRSVSDLLNSVRTAQKKTIAEVSALLPSVLDRCFRGEL